MSRLAVLSLTDPDAVTSGGTARTRALRDAVRSAGHDVECFFPTTGAASLGTRVPGRLGALKRHFLPLPTVAGGRNPALAQRLAAAGPFDAVIVSALSQVPLAAATGAPVWVDFMDLWSAFADREAAARSGPARVTARAQARRLRRAEEAAIAGGAAVTAAGWRDAEVLRDRRHAISWLPTPAPSRPAARRPGPVRTVGLLGDFTYWPNLDAHDVLVRHWLPGLRDAGVDVVVAGRGSADLPPVAGVERLGPVDRLEDFYARVDAVLAPVRLGGGIKVKVVEALLAGVPVVATRIALEGLPPAVRDLAAAVEPTGSAAAALPALPAVDPGDPRLHPLTTTGFAEAVDDVLARLLRVRAAA
ncbi:glycosyltransferase family 4 protein [Actinomycetospora sp. NBRC 106378]|uniref:glycosyltransferase n=1 Tax=Actinomycetospora sp. NBRC 106378 TaxID=3032208 RepID=UPI0024A3B371|nr:glycosyltransferase family 4 protein [Actinomycetospora sp. NBRC 106378]GLZ51765.1 hypothetical protein Acsp07_13820 [Actinomycetospora sp. NBRC 106378]